MSCAANVFALKFTLLLLDGIYGTLLFSWYKCYLVCGASRDPRFYLFILVFGFRCFIFPFLCMYVNDLFKDIHTIVEIFFLRFLQMCMAIILLLLLYLDLKEKTWGMKMSCLKRDMWSHFHFYLLSELYQRCS